MSDALPIAPASSTAASDSLVRSAGITSFAVFLSRISGLVREMLMARYFGASLAYDAFTLGFRIPNLTRDLFAEGALSSAFVPIFTQQLKNEGLVRAARVANLVACTLALVVGLICLIGVLLSPQLVTLLASGFHQVEGKHELAVRLTRIMFPFLLLVALAAQAMGVLNALNQFAVPALSSTFFNIGSVAFGFLFGFALGPTLGLAPIEGMAWGVVCGGALQLLVQFPSLARSGFRFEPALDFSDPAVRHILTLMGPAILGNAAVQINVMVNTNFASALADPIRGPDGPVSWLTYAFRFMQLPLGLFGVAIGSATLPAISRSAASGAFDDFRRTLSRSVGLVFLLTIPSSVGLILLGPSMIGAIYEGGKFDAYDTQQAGLALSYFAIGLAGYAAVKVLTPAFYALGDSRTPMIISLLSIGINYFTVSSLVRQTHLGHPALALSTSIVALFAFLVQFLIMRNRVQGIYGRDLFRSTMQILVSAMVMGGGVYLSTTAIQSWLGTSKSARLADLAISIPFGCLIYYGACKFFGVAELAMADRALAAPLRRLGFKR